MTPKDDHPLRYALVNELHARPSLRLRAPCTLAYLAFKEPVNAARRDRACDHAHLADLVARHGGAAPDAAASHYSGRLGRFDLRWESHTEFVSYAGASQGMPASPFDPQAAALFAPDWQQQAPGRRLAAMLFQVDLLPPGARTVPDRLGEWFAPDSLATAWVLDGKALVASDFRIDSNGWMRFAVFVDPSLGAGRTGRIVQRLHEMETYRAMSMLGLAVVRDLSPRLNRLDRELGEIVGDMGRPGCQADELLHQLIAISAELEAEAVRHSFRFGATAAYEAIVHDRMAALREAAAEGRQTLSEFMARRYEPAMRTVRSLEQRLHRLAERAERAGELLRTRVDVQRSAQNQALLTSMDRRADMALRLQHTVEGLSVVAISYYAVGLLGYVAAPLAKWAGIDKSVLIAVAVPVVLGLVWLGLRRLRASLHDEGHEPKKRRRG